jgi:hypothetical protein
MSEELNQKTVNDEIKTNQNEPQHIKRIWLGKYPDPAKYRKHPDEIPNKKESDFVVQIDNVNDDGIRAFAIELDGKPFFATMKKSRVTLVDVIESCDAAYVPRLNPANAPNDFIGKLSETRVQITLGTLCVMLELLSWCNY